MMKVPDGERLLVVVKQLLIVEIVVSIALKVVFLLPATI
jgi:hypothetical protein